MSKKNKQFSQQQDDEEIIFVIKKHPWYFWNIIVYTILALLIIFLGFKYYGASAFTSWAIILSIFIIAFLFINKYFSWNRTQYILTNHRVISFDQEKIFKKTMKEARLENILFISNKVEGWLNSLIERGSVHIRASGVAEDDIVFIDIANPYDVQKQITEAQKKYVGIVAKQEEDGEQEEDDDNDENQEYFKNNSANDTQFNDDQVNNDKNIDSIKRK